MALNIKPLFGPHYPFMHPEVTYPSLGIQLESHQKDEQEVAEKDKRHHKLLNRLKLVKDTKNLLLRRLDCW